MKNIKLKLQWKLTLAFMSVIILAIIFVGFFTNYYVEFHFQRFCELSENSIPRCLQGEAGRNFLKSINDSLVWVGGLGFIISVLFGYFLSKLILNPLQKVMLVIKRFSSGDYSVRITIKTKDEINDLIEALNEMFSSLEKLEKLRKDLIANLSHELSTPLTNIYGYLEALDDKVINNESQRRRAINIVKEESKRLILLTRELKKLAILEADNFSLYRKKTDINNLIGKVCEKFEPRIREKKIDIHKKFDQNLPEINIDPMKFEQVVFNLLDNAIKYSFDKNIIKIKTDRKGNEFLLSVKDYGPGIANEDVPFIFERFYRVDKARTKKDNSAGIGLAIVKKIIKAHGGDIKVKSEKGKKTEFLVYLPIWKKRRN